MLETYEITNFTAGELSPRLRGRTDYKNYYNGLDTCLNMVVLPQGGVTRRPGTVLAALAKSQSSNGFTCRLIPFIFSTVQAYQLELTDLNFRVYMNDGVVISGGVPVDIAVPYPVASLWSLQYVQSADTLFLLHPALPPATLQRSSHISWTYSALTFRDGPYLSLNSSTTTLTPSGTTGAITLTASSAVGINPTPASAGQGFLATDVGRLVRIKLLSLWAWCKITGWTSPTVVSATVQAAVTNGAVGAIDGAPWAAATQYVTGAVVTTGGNLYQATAGGTSSGTAPTGTNPAVPNYDGSVQWQFLAAGSLPVATKQWRLGKWSNTTGYPLLPTFWQQRLVCLGTTAEPSAVEASVPGDYTNFAPTRADGTVTDANGLSWVISDDQVNAIRWVSPSGSSIAMQLGIGTTGGEQIMQPATNSLPLSGTNVQVYRETSIGSAGVAAVVRAIRVGKSVLFANRPGRKLMDWIWQWAVNGYVALDRTVDAEHVTRTPLGALQGIREMAWQQQPYGVLWCVRGDGQLIGMTYLPEQNVYAWHRHALGGQYYGGSPVVESLSVIPSTDGTTDEVWLSVLRTVGGVVTRTIEVMTRYFDGLPVENAVHSDCGLSNALTFPAATLTPAAASGTGVLFTASASIFSSGSVGGYLRINGGLVLVQALVSGFIVRGDYLRPAIFSQPQGTGNWSLTAQFSTFHGLDHLNGETVVMLGDGADFGTTVVAAGAITLNGGGTASFVTAGLPYTSRIVGMPFAPLRAAQSAQGRVKRIDHIYLRLLESLGCSYGQRRTDPLTGAVDDALEDLETRSAGDVLGQVPSLFSGIRRLALPGGYDQEGQVEIQSMSAYPLTVLAVECRGDVGEASQ